MTKRPLVDTTIRTEFGDVLEDASFYDTSSVDRDLTYVPGFSEMRRARDFEISEVASGRKLKHEAKIVPLPVNVRWVRRTTPKGSPDGAKQIATGNLGYRTVNKSQIGQEWLTKQPPGSVVEADGSISKGDTVLMVCDAKTAARNAARKTVATQRLTDAINVGGAAGGLLSINKQGTDAFVRKEA